jgi:hypothetical protein
MEPGPLKVTLSKAMSVSITMNVTVHWPPGMRNGGVKTLFDESIWTGTWIVVWFARKVTPVVRGEPTILGIPAFSANIVHPSF